MNMNMFSYCSSLNLSNNVKEMDEMFDGIKKSCDLIYNDKKILNLFRGA